MLPIETLTSEVQRLQNAVDWWNNFGLVFTAIIAIGAVGYYLASKKTFNIGAQLRQAQVSLANVQQEQLRRDLKEKDLMIEKERLARMKIEEKLAPRSLNQAQCEILLAKLVQFAGTVIDIIIYPGGTPDTITFSNQIASVLAAAKWQVAVTKVLAATASVSGIIVAIKDKSDANAMAAAKALTDGLNSEGIATAIMESFPPPPQAIFGGGHGPNKVVTIKMLIGTKP
jgi:hypothetical protein